LDTFQFCHVIGIAPTILEVAGIPEPDFVNGVMQRRHPRTTRLAPLGVDLMSGDSVVGLISTLEAKLPLGIDLEHGAEVGLLYLFMPLFVESHQ